MSNSDQEQFVDNMRRAVEEVLAEREEVGRLDKIEKLLASTQNTINDLNKKIEDKSEELASASSDKEDLQAQIAELKVKADKLEAKLTEANKSSEGLEVRATAAEKELAGIAADRGLEVRMAELVESKVAKSEAKRDSQSEKVRSMSDEEFAAYKQEMVDLRSDIKAELVQAALLEKSTAAADSTMKVKGTVDVAPPDVTSGAQDDAAAAAALLNVEIASVDTKSNYLEFANAMAANLSAGRE